MYKFKSILFLILILEAFLSSQHSYAQCGSCTNPTGAVSVGSGQSICYDANTTLTSLQVFFDGKVTICDGVILTVSGQTQLSGTAQIIMNNCSEIDMIGSFTCSSNNAFIYNGDSTCDARVTIHSSSDLCASLTNNSHIHYCNLNSSPTTGSPGAATVGCGLSLPIELVYFNAIPEKNRRVKLEWQTASEINNDFFTVERSFNAVDWEIVKKVDGAGNSNTRLNYSLIDNNPYRGVSYYRLKQTDFNGKFEYSSIKSINLKEQFADAVEIYPNPTDNQITVTSNTNELSEVRIFNALGQDVTNLTSKNSLNESTITIDLSLLAKGMYYVKTGTTVNNIYKK